MHLHRLPPVLAIRTTIPLLSTKETTNNIVGINKLCVGVTLGLYWDHIGVCNIGVSETSPFENL